MALQMFSRLILVAAVAAVGVAFAPAEAATKRASKQLPPPTVDGMASIHAISREGGRLCFADHWHYGTSLGQPTEQAAKAAAVKSWYGLVDIEYGAAWSNFGKSAQKSIKCERSSAGWGCAISSRPCK